MESTQNPNNCHSYHSSRHWSCRSISQSDPNNRKLHWNLSGESAWRTDWTFLEGLKPSSEQISSKVPYCLILLLKSVEHQELWRFLQDSCPSKWSHICSQLFLLWQWTLREVLRVSWKKRHFHDALDGICSVWNANICNVSFIPFIPLTKDYQDSELRKATWRPSPCEVHPARQTCRHPTIQFVQEWDIFLHNFLWFELLSFVILVSVFCFSVCLVVL